MRVIALFLFLIVIPTISIAQDLGNLEETSVGNFFGISARQMAMGGTGIANSIDGAAIFYNPAALARIPRIEFQIGLTHQKFNNESSQLAGRYDPPAEFRSTLNSSSIDATKTRFNTLNLTVPIPTYRGSLVVGVGINRITSFDRVSFLHLIDRRISDNALIDDQVNEHETGRIFLYSGAVGIDLTPNLSIGGALNVFAGYDKLAYTYNWIDNTQHPDSSSGGFTNQFDDDYFGVGVKGGLLYRPNNRITFGLTIESPIYWEIQQGYIDGDYIDVVEYDLIHPFKLGTGLSYSHKQLTLTADAEYVDWSQLEYTDNNDMEQYNDSLSNLYRDVLNLRGGIEYQFPKTGVALRAGIFSKPLPYHSKFIIDDEMGYSFGFGWLLDKVLLIEAAYVNGGLKRTYTSVNAEFTVADNKMAVAEDRYKRFYLTLSYRY
ncbi:MAG: hypothetical protein KAR42_02105 [candidate division Zixibacteria bacterium]|nr:hypothetical protein [candidate division Zixibacteria bacterium]